jgi:spore coat protein CotH
MKISQKIEIGQIDHTYMSSWKDDNEVELYKGDDTVVFTMSEDVMKQLHKKLGDKLTELAAARLEDAHKLAQQESSDDE